MQQVIYAGFVESNPDNRDVLTMQEARIVMGSLFSSQFVQPILGAIETLQYDAYALGVQRTKEPPPITGTTLAIMKPESDPGPGFMTPEERERKTLRRLIDDFEKMGGIVTRSAFGQPITLSLPKLRKSLGKVVDDALAARPAKKRGRPFADPSKAVDPRRADRLSNKRVGYYMRTKGWTRLRAIKYVDANPVE